MREKINKHQDHLFFLESLDKINKATQGMTDLQQMMRDVLDVVLSILDCDRAFLLNSSDPDTSAWSIPMERTKPESPGAYAASFEVPITTEGAKMLRVLLDTKGPVHVDLESEMLSPDVAEQFSIKSFLAMAIYPKVGKPWYFGIQQCSHARIWTESDKELFKVIGHRIADSLSLLLGYQELLENRMFLDNIFENIPNMVFVKDAKELRFVRLNKGGEQLLGYSQQDLIGKNDYDFFTKDEADFFTAKDREVLNRKELVNIPEETIHTKYGERLLQTKKIPLFDKTGNPAYLLGISEDITERKQMYKALQSSEERLMLATEAAQMGLWDWNIVTGEVMWSDQCKAHYGLSPETSMSYDVFLQAVHPDDRDRVESALNRAVEERTSYKVTKRTIWPDGSIHWTNSRGQVHCDTTGKPVRMVGITFDITERKRAEDELRKLSHAIEQSPVSIVITDVEGNIEFVNTKFTQITGYTYAEALDQNPRILKSGETPAEEYNQLWKTISSGGVWQGEFRNCKKNGELFWEQATIAPVRDADNVITHYVAVKEDITERKKLEAQLRQTQKMEAVGQLAGGVAHDFNNMLGVIIGHAELAIRNEALDDSLRRHLKAILEASSRSTEITRQLLAFARKQTINPKVLDLNDTLEGMLKLLRRLIGEDIDLVWVPGANLWRVKMDPTQIDQILVNLCVNARDAIGGVGKVTIDTKKVVFDDAYCAEHKGFVPGEYVRLAVSDNGLGMDKRTINRIFEPFFTTKGMGKGTGLGLATVYGIVKQNAGFINVYSEPGHGTTFKIYLPRPKAEIDQVPKASSAQKTLGGDETILVVEDEPLHLQMVKHVLEKLGYRVIAASSPGEALLVAREHTGIHLLLSDVILPDMTGPDLAKEVTSLLPDAICLFMSGYTGSAINHHGLLDEGVNFIQKPFSMQELAIKVREMLDSK